MKIACYDSRDNIQGTYICYSSDNETNVEYMRYGSMDYIN